MSATAQPEYETELVVARRKEEAAGVVSLTLRHRDGAPLPSWEAGAHIDLLLDDAPEGPLVRQYSLCGDPADAGAWQIAVLREPDGTGRGGSAHVHAALAEGSTVRVCGPRNHFALRPAARYLFVAGGIGVTPILPMLSAAEAAGTPWTLLYGGRTLDSMAFLDRLTELDAARGLVTFAPQDETGLLDLAGFLGSPDPDTLVYCCGPGPLLDAAEEYCADLEPDTLRVERFSASAADPDAVNTAFELELAASGLTVTVAPDASILETLLEAGVNVHYSCTEGNCGSCATEIIEGEADHRDDVLNSAEQASQTMMMVCVSRSRGPRLVLDL